jgi:hypothetical protein
MIARWREWSMAQGRFIRKPAIVDRNGNRGDRETGLRPKDESDGAGTAIAHTPPDTKGDI